MLLTFAHWLHAAAMYIQCHCFTELRAMWVGWSTTVPFCGAIYCILNMDIMQMQNNFMSNIPVEKVWSSGCWPAAPRTEVCLLGATSGM
eukprot:537666-Amphidinium_carterae.1